MTIALMKGLLTNNKEDEKVVVEYLNIWVKKLLSLRIKINDDL